MALEMPRHRFLFAAVQGVHRKEVGNDSSEVVLCRILWMFTPNLQNLRLKVLARS